MSIEALNSVFALGRRVVSMKERLLLVVLANHVNKGTGMVFISVATMAAEAGTFPSTIRPILHRLEAKSLIVEVAPAGRYRPRTFRLNLPIHGSDFPDAMTDSKPPTSPTPSVDQGSGKCPIKASGNENQGVGKCEFMAPTSPTPIPLDPLDPSAIPRAHEMARAFFETQKKRHGLIGCRHTPSCADDAACAAKHEALVRSQAEAFRAMASTPGEQRQ
ncbi:MAG: hypothetical protein IMZ67_06575 [Acidobacteria bacterium]|nr:hypothetical protein [Acidobacteriota bacterium]